MGATVVTPSASYWVGQKPSDYKNSSLEKALSTLEGLDDKVKSMKIPLKIDLSAKASIKEFDDNIATLKAAIAEFEKAKTSLNQVITAAKTAQGVAAKTSAELLKLSKGKNVDEQAYKIAAQSANQVGEAAGDKAKEYA